MTTTPPPDRPGPGRPDRSPAGGAATAAADGGGGLDLGVAQVAASALAAVTSAVAASTLGVAGTLVGAGVGAVVATVGSAVYTHSLRRAGARLRDFRPVDDGRWPAIRPSGSPSGPGASEPGSSGPGASADEPVQPLAADTPGAAVPVSAAAAEAAEGRRPWRRGAVVVGAGFVLALAGITGAEAVLGHPISSSSEPGTSVGRAVTGGSGGSGEESKTPTSTPSPSTATSSVTSEPESSTSSTSSVPDATTSSPSATASPGLSAPSEATSAPAEPTTAPPSPQESAPETPAPVAPTSSDGE